MTHTILLIATAMAALAAISTIPLNRRRRHRIRRLAKDATRWTTDPDHGVFA